MSPSVPPPPMLAAVPAAAGWNWMFCGEIASSVKHSVPGPLSVLEFHFVLSVRTCKTRPIYVNGPHLPN